jgi:hypothetical protein
MQSGISGQEIALIPTEVIQRGGCFIEGQFGSLDARVGTQLQMVGEALTGLLKEGDESGANPPRDGIALPPAMPPTWEMGHDAEAELTVGIGTIPTRSRGLTTCGAGWPGLGKYHRLLDRLAACASQAGGSCGRPDYRSGTGLPDWWCGEIQANGSSLLLAEAVDSATNGAADAAGEMQGMQPGSPIYPLRTVFRTPVGTALLGRVLTAGPADRRAQRPG